MCICCRIAIGGTGGRGCTTLFRRKRASWAQQVQENHFEQLGPCGGRTEASRLSDTRTARASPLSGRIVGKYEEEGEGERSKLGQ